MIRKLAEGSGETLWNRGITVLLVVALVVPLLAMAPASEVPLGAQPILLDVIAEHPEAMVRVIAQKTSKDAGIEELVARLGGVVTADLHIINAFAAQLPGKAVPELARATGVRWVALDGIVESTGKPPKGGDDAPLNYFLDTLNVRAVWAEGVQGQGVAVAVIDSGISSGRDFTADPTAGGGRGGSRIVVRKAFGAKLSANDNRGHGTFVAGIIGGNGANSDGLYAGIAPMVELISLAIGNADGMAYESDTVAAMQWVLTNKDQYNIRVVNLSINSTVEQSYHISPLDAAAEMLWFSGIVVVASAGNSEPADGYNTIKAAPANDPWIITVGASNEWKTSAVVDDSIATFSASGTTGITDDVYTDDVYSKPEIVAPGKDIVSVLAQNSKWDREHSDRVVGNGKYFRLSGTSMAAPMVAGAAALLLQVEPDLTPNQVKYRLMNATSEAIGGYAYLDVYAAVMCDSETPPESANYGIWPSQLLGTVLGTGGDSVQWDSVQWDSVQWDSVQWDSVQWDSVQWDSVQWDSVQWDSVQWDSVQWDSVQWDSDYWGD